MNWTERCWAQVDLQALRRNYRRLRGLLSPRQKYLAVVKANAYGHGAVPVALALEEEGADWFGAATLEEGEELRRGGVTRPILLFGYTPPTAARCLAAGKLTQGVFSGEYAAALGAEALRAGVQVDFHLMVDSGMGRLGLRPGEPDSLRQAAEILANPALRCTGTFTHFAVADELGEASSAFTGEQFARFEGFLDRMRKAGMDPGLCHCANSAAAILTPGMRLGMCRFGIVQYGLSPSEEVGWTELEPVMSLRATVAMVKEIHPALYRPGAPENRHCSHRLRRRVPPVRLAGGAGHSEGTIRPHRRAGLYGPADGGRHRHPPCGARRPGDPGGPGGGGGNHLGRGGPKERHRLLRAHLRHLRPGTQGVSGRAIKAKGASGAKTFEKALPRSRACRS